MFCAFLGGSFISFDKNKESRLMINEEIRDEEVRVIDSTGTDLGVMRIDRALNLATESGNLDLVKVAPNSCPPVCKIMDYGKFCFEKTKKEKEMRKNQHIVSIKEIRLTVATSENDMRIKANKVKEFIKNGDKVRVALRFRGREKAFGNIGADVLNKFFAICKDEKLCGDSVVMVKPPKQETRNMFMFLAPNQIKKSSSGVNVSKKSGNKSSVDAPKEKLNEEPSEKSTSRKSSEVGDNDA